MTDRSNKPDLIAYTDRWVRDYIRTTPTCMPTGERETTPVNARGLVEFMPAIPVYDGVETDVPCGKVLP